MQKIKFIPRTSSGLVKIEDLTYPSEVQAGETFNVSYYTRNISSQSLTVWGEILDGTTVIPGSQWQYILQPGEKYYSQITIPGRYTDLYGTVQVGHIEEEMPPIEIDIWKMATILLGTIVLGAILFKGSKNRE